jgi:hypothetical protein
MRSSNVKKINAQIALLRRLASLKKMLTRTTRASHSRWVYIWALTVGVFSMLPTRGQESPAPLTFDVASIKLNAVKQFENKSSIQSLGAGEGFSVRNAPMITYQRDV